MKTTTKSSKSLIGIVVLIIIVLVYFFLTGNKAPESQTLVQLQVTPEANTTSSRILSLLNLIENLNIDTEIFSNSAFQSLEDYSIPIPDVPVGRPDPFAPISGAPEEFDGQ